MYLYAYGISGIITIRLRLKYNRSLLWQYPKNTGVNANRACIDPTKCVS